MWHHRIKRIEKYSDMSTINWWQATTAVTSCAQMQGQPQQHCGTCCHAACDGIRENFKLKGNNQLVASQQFAVIAMIAATAKQQITISGQMATELWCHWQWFLHQLLCHSEQWLSLVTQWVAAMKREVAMSAMVVCNLICWEWQQWKWQNWLAASFELIHNGNSIC